MSGLVPLEDATATILAACAPLEVVEVALDEALGAVLAETVVSDEAIPPFDNTAMDGFAVRAVDTQGAPQVLRLVGTLPAGAAPTARVGEGEAIRIMTGAPMPPGADAVVMVERASVDPEQRAVTVEVSVEPGTHVRRAGEDVRPGDQVLAAGAELTPGRLGVLASLGYPRIRVVRRPVVGVFSTGDELVEGPGDLAPGQIRDSNRPTLLALLRESGYEVRDLGRIPDDEEAIAAAVREGCAQADALVTSGGVSMGDLDYVKVVLDRLGAMHWMQVAIKPAKPLAFGTVEGVPVFGLPGNPVSSMVSYELFARPALRRMSGQPDDRLERPRVRATADEDLRRRPDAKTHLVRVRCRWEGDGYRVRSAGGQGSHQLTAMAAADALAVLEDGHGVAAGEPVEVLLLR